MTSDQCISCIHYRLSTGGCKAFPKKVPVEIITGQHDHRDPYKGDKGIRWTPRPLPEEKSVSLPPE